MSRFRRWSARIWAWWSHIDTAGGVPGWYMWGKPLIGALLAAASGYFAWAQRIPIAFAIPATLLSVCAVVWLMNLLRITRAAAGVVVPSKDSDHAAIDGFMCLGSHEFYSSQDALKARRPLMPALRSTETSWIRCAVGTAIRSHDAVKSGRIQRLLLASPDRMTLEPLALAFGRSVEDLSSQIQLLTAEAQAREVEVKWSAGAMGDALIIGDPDSISGWAQVEAFLPGIPQNERPGFRIERVAHDKLFSVLKTAFEFAWEQASQPNVEFRRRT